uniref:Fibrinogen C-terminal domain-containing protein n=1 Tax=Accipiter nisus TaxID=211598 RepID=A0A8B9MRG6_9AVES
GRGAPPPPFPATWAPRAPSGRSPPPPPTHGCPPPTPKKRVPKDFNAAKKNPTRRFSRSVSTAPSVFSGVGTIIGWDSGELTASTGSGRYELRVELEDFENNTAAATYGTFALSPHAVSAEEDGYTLHVGNFVDGGAGRGARGGAPSRRGPSGGGTGSTSGVGRGYGVNVGHWEGLWGQRRPLGGVTGSTSAIGRGHRVNVGHWEGSPGQRRALGGVTGSTSGIGRGYGVNVGHWEGLRGQHRPLGGVT